MRLGQLFIIFSAVCVGLFGREGRIDHFQEKVTQILESVDPSAQVAIKIVSLRTGEVLFEKNPHIRMVPASVAKLYTVAAGFDQLGPNFQFETKLLCRRVIRNGVLEGDLYLKGGGDPALKQRHFAILADQLKERGIHSVERDLIVDTTVFDAIQSGPGWMWDDMLSSFCTPICGLNVDHGRLAIHIEPSAQKGGAPSVRYAPTSEEIVICNKAKMGSTTKGLTVKRAVHREGQPIEICGEMAIEEGPQKFKVAALNPPAHAAFQLANALREKGIAFKGQIHFKKTPSGAITLATYRSLPLQELSKKIIKKTDNLYADSLFKRLGDGTWSGGSKKVRRFLSDKLGIDHHDVIQIDGSGLSRYNLTTVDQVVSLLTWVHNEAPFAAEFKSSLSIAGVDGTLKKRFDSGRFRSKIRAKTGTMTSVTAIAGYLTTKEKEPIVFAIMANGFVSSAREMKSDLEDAILNECLYIANSRGE